MEDESDGRHGRPLGCLAEQVGKGDRVVPPAANRTELVEWFFGLR
jgi:hypothetical protein